MIENIMNALIEPMKILAVIIITVLLIAFIGYSAETVLDKFCCTKDETCGKQQPAEVSSKSELVTTSYTFIMKDGTTNYVDLTQVKEMNTNFDFIKKETTP